MQSEGFLEIVIGGSLMTRLQRPRKSTSGRKVSPDIAAGTRRARGRLVEPGPRAASREAQLRARMEVEDIRPGDRLAHFNAHRCDPPDMPGGCTLGCHWTTPDYLRISALADAYARFEPVRGRSTLEPFTDAELDAIVAGDIEAYMPPEPAPRPQTAPAVTP